MKRNRLLLSVAIAVLLLGIVASQCLSVTEGDEFAVWHKGDPIPVIENLETKETFIDWQSIQNGTLLYQQMENENFSLMDSDDELIIFIGKNGRMIDLWYDYLVYLQPEIPPNAEERREREPFLETTSAPFSKYEKGKYFVPFHFDYEHAGASSNFYFGYVYTAIIEQCGIVRKYNFFIPSSRRLS